MEQQKTSVLHEERQRSVGEKIFDWTTYSGINGIGTFALTLPVAYFLKHGGGKPHYDKAAAALERQLVKVLPQDISGKASKIFLETSILMQGGNAMLLPVGIAEHYKVPIVKGLNQFLGDKTDPSTIEAAPKQTAMTLIRGRLRAFGIVFGAMAFAETFFGNHMRQFQQAAGRALCAFRNRPIDPHSKPYHYGELAALDVFSTAAAAVLLYEGSHKFAKEAQRKRASTVTRTDSTFPDNADTPGVTVTQAERAPETLAQAQAQTAIRA
jgi:hypothetical protein